MKFLITILTLLISTVMLAQKQSTFIYELTLFDQYKHKSMWSEREHDIQQAHVSYLDSLEKSGKLLIAGITDQNLEDHKGFVILNMDNYDNAFEHMQNDPSIKEGMMKGKLRPMNIYFKKQE